MPKYKPGITDIAKEPLSVDPRPYASAFALAAAAEAGRSLAKRAIARPPPKQPEPAPNSWQSFTKDMSKMGSSIKKTLAGPTVNDFLPDPPRK